MTVRVADDRDSARQGDPGDLTGDDVRDAPGDAGGLGETRCPNCGATVAAGRVDCQVCGSPIAPGGG